MKKIIQQPDEVLRKVSIPVPPEMFGSDKLNTILKDMSTLLSKENDGVAIAAPQIGVSYRIFVISKKVFKDEIEDIVCINPEIIKLGKKKVEVSEGCMSVRWKYGTVKRSETATIRAQNERGHTFVLPGRGLVAQIFQHETDHLNGTLFIDKARNLEDVPPTPTNA